MCTSDWEMQNTSVADWRKLTALGCYPVDIQFGPKSVNTKLAVFRELDKMILSKKTLQSLGIEVINKYLEALPKEVIPIQK